MDHHPATTITQAAAVKKKFGALNLAMAASTDVGKTRTVNEDFFYFSDSLQLAIVCDGMGGLQGGATASRMAGKTFRDAFSISDLALLARLCDDVKEKLPSPLLKMAVGTRLANRRVYLSGRDDRSLKGMGTTIAAVVLADNMVYLAHVGDSRVYLMRDSMLMQLTQDHSWINELLEDQDIQKDEVKNFRKKNVLTRALGTHPAIKIDLQCLPVQENDTFLICTDGLFNALGEEQILTAILEHNGNLKTAADTLVQSAKMADGSDNITAVLVTVAGKPAGDAKHKPASVVLPEEEPRIFVLEDRFLRERYALNAQAPSEVSDRRKLFWGGAIVGFALLMVLVVYIIWRKPVSSELIATESEPIANSVVREDVPSPVHGANVATGHLALVQFSSTKNLQELSAMPGVKVLDSFTLARNEKASASGKYSFILVDSSARVVYRQNKISIGKSTKSVKPAANQEKKPSNKATEQLKTSGHVYIVGLDGVTPAEANIFANEDLVAPVRQVINSGFFLKPGTYSLSIRDASGRVILNKKNVKIQKGEVKAVELSR